MKIPVFIQKLGRSDKAIKIIAPLVFFSIVMGAILWLITPHAQTTPKSLTTTAQTTQLPAPEQHHRSQTTTIRTGDHLSKCFKRLKVPQQTLAQLMQNKTFKRTATSLKPGHTLSITQNGQGTLLTLDYKINAQQTLHAERDTQGQWVVTTQQQPVTTQTGFAKITINHSLDQAIKAQGLGYPIAKQLIDIFGDQINLNQHLQPGDTFTIMYEKRMLNGKAIGTGPIISAVCQHRNKSIHAIRYTTSRGTDYYDRQGRNLHKAYLRYPCRYKRVSSKFNLHRVHPILRTPRPHYGVDLAARTGTPIYTVGDGVVRMARFNGGYGRMIKIQHSTNRATIYAHLSRFAKRLRRGQRVKKGQLIGYVGSTGFATGPHLHFEVRLNKRPVNPLRTPLPGGKNLTDQQMVAYQAQAQKTIDAINQWTHKAN